MGYPTKRTKLPKVPTKLNYIGIRITTKMKRQITDAAAAEETTVTEWLKKAITAKLNKKLEV